MLPDSVSIKPNASVRSTDSVAMLCSNPEYRSIHIDPLHVGHTVEQELRVALNGVVPGAEVLRVRRGGAARRPEPGQQPRREGRPANGHRASRGNGVEDREPPPFVLGFTRLG